MRYLFASTAFVVALAAADKPIAPAMAEDELLVLEASAYTDKAGVTGVLGMNPGMDLIVVQVKLAPRGENKVTIDLDDFTLISRKDGQRSQPLAPSQVAGNSVLVVTPGGQGGGGGIVNTRRGPIWGGMPGTGTRPRRVGNDDDVVGGVAGPTGPEATVAQDGKKRDNELIDVLKAKALPRKETNEPITGLLYFILEGKHKLKDLELMYKSPAGRMILDFQR